MTHRSKIEAMQNALDSGIRNNLRINGETMTHNLNSDYSVVDRVTTRITLATSQYEAHIANRDFYLYPFSSLDYNPLSPFAVY